MLDLTDGPLELRWDDGSATTFDTHSDWSLEIVDGPWQDPFADVSADRLRELESEVGVWVAREVGAGDPLWAVTGQELRSVVLERNEMDELGGARLAFESVTMRVFGWGGFVRVEIA
ncbi:MAG: hypothetical protein ACT4QF_07945 [Sporichthyaceae bacterium]